MVPGPAYVGNWYVSELYLQDLVWPMRTASIATGTSLNQAEIIWKLSEILYSAQYRAERQDGPRERTMSYMRKPFHDG
jgi:hypothetical protein